MVGVSRTSGPQYLFAIFVLSSHWKTRKAMPGSAVETSSVSAPKTQTISTPRSSKIRGWWLSHPSEKYENQLGWLFPIYIYICRKKCSKPPTRYVFLSGFLVESFSVFAQRPSPPSPAAAVCPRCFEPGAPGAKVWWPWPWHVSMHSFPQTEHVHQFLWRFHDCSW